MGSAIQRLNNRPLRIVFRLALKTHTLGLQHLPWMIHFAKRDLKTTITTILCILRECILYFPGSRHSQWGDGGLYYNRPINTVEPPCATAKAKRPNFPSQSLTVGTPSKRPPSEDCDHFLGVKVNCFPWATSWRILCSSFLLCALCSLENMKTFSDIVELHIS